MIRARLHQVKYLHSRTIHGSGGARVVHLPVHLLSFSCSLRRKFNQIIGWYPQFGRLAPPGREIPHPPQYKLAGNELGSLQRNLSHNDKFFYVSIVTGSDSDRVSVNELLRYFQHKWLYVSVTDLDFPR